MTVLKTDKDHTRSVTNLKFKQRYVYPKGLEAPPETLHQVQIKTWKVLFASGYSQSPGLDQLPKFLVEEHYQRAYFLVLPHHPPTQTLL